MAEVVVTVVDLNVDVNICEQDVVVLSSESGPQGPRGTQVLSGASDPSIVIGILGDQYINTFTGTLFGPKTQNGWGSGLVLGSIGLQDIAYTHYQTIASSEWSIPQSEHGLQFPPNVTVVDLSGDVIEGVCQYTANDIILTFSENLIGAAYLS